MAIRDLFKKLTGRVKESITGEPGEELEEELGEELGAGAEEAPEEELFKKEAPTGKAAPEEKPEEEFEEAHEEKPEAGDLRGQLEGIKNKLDLVDAHLKTIESKEDLFKIETERYMQYFTFISEKIDHLERELAEVERLIKKK